MKRNENTDTGEVSFHFNSDEWKKLKIAGIAAGLLLAASLGTAVYSAVSMESLSRQNQLYQNQLKMAEEKMKSLEDKTATIEKLSDQLQDMVKANSNGAAQNMTGGNRQQYRGLRGRWSRCPRDLRESRNCWRPAL